jgi:hypothetical protein
MLKAFLGCKGESLHQKAFTAVLHFIGPFRNTDVRLIGIDTAFEGKTLHVVNLFQGGGEHKKR